MSFFFFLMVQMLSANNSNFGLLYTEHDTTASGFHRPFIEGVNIEEVVESELNRHCYLKVDFDGSGCTKANQYFQGLIEAV